MAKAQNEYDYYFKKDLELERYDDKGQIITYGVDFLYYEKHNWMNLFRTTEFYKQNTLTNSHPNSHKNFLQNYWWPH